MRTVVTGGAGFIGSHLVDAILGRGWSVVVIDDLSSGFMENVTRLQDEPRFEFIEADICGEWTVDGPVDLVLNFASLASPQKFLEYPLETIEVGAAGMRRVAEMAIDKGARLIQASTSEVYGEPLLHPQPEDYWGNVNPIGPRSVYDEWKRYAEALLGAYHRLGKLDVGIVRIFNTYGPRLHATDGRVVSNFIHQALHGKPLTVYGTGEQTRSFCYVGDLVRGVLALADLKGEFGPINLGSQQEFSILGLARIVGELTDVDVNLTYSELPVDDPTQRRPDISRAREILGWQPETELREGLLKTIEWFSTASLPVSVR